MAKLKITPLVWKNCGPTEHTDENLIRFAVDEDLPQGIEAYIARHCERWHYETVVDGCDPVESETSFDSAPEAAIGLEHWLTDRAAGFRDPRSSPERGN